MTNQSIEKIEGQLRGFVERFGKELGRSERRHWCGVYLRGLLLEGERKSIEPMAGRLEGGNEQALQQFINQSPWEAEDVAMKLCDELVGELKIRQAVLVLDDTSLPKKGLHSVGVARQYCGALGKVANCQSLVSWHVVGKKEHFPALGRLYLPKEWTQDVPRMRRAGVSREHQGFQEKWKIALDLLERVKGRIDYRALVFDAGYGEIGPFLCELEKRGEPYVAQVPRSQCYWPADVAVVSKPNSTGRPRRYPCVANKEIRPLNAFAWGKQIKNWRRLRLPTRKKTQIQATALRVRAVDHKAYYRQGPERWLFIEKLPDGAMKYYVSNLPPSTSLKELIELAHQRWKVEQGYQQLKEELGLDHFEGRSWRGLHHHLVLCFMAYDFLTLLRRKHPKKTKRRPCLQCAVG